ncbi:MAG: sigma-54 dependent transcriptional regulator [Muribaculaceae bacterium]|nr:sigma-54 dependent transcriptional regulator [Muribaculaceae bacterium]
MPLNRDIITNADAQPEVVRAKQRFGIVGNAPALNAAVRRAVMVAPIDLSVLITGESGTGKEFFPQIIHANSARKHAKYIAVNCGAIPEGTIDSELFGHEKGAFTGAVASRKGYFEEADGGTIFLDEVAELPLPTQARLLRVLESGEFMKVGSSTVQKTNIRVVAATNVDLPRAIAEGKFREDLFYRLSTVQISVPPLRERGNDIMLLARRFLSAFSEKYMTPEVTFDDSARITMLRYRWPGNVRQLKNVVEQVALFEAGHTVNAETLAQYPPSGSAEYTPARPGGEHSYEREREMLFNMIFNLRNRIDELTARLDETPLTDAVEVSQPSQPASAPMPHLPAPLLRDLKPLEPTAQPDERAAIVEALRRADGRRKAAAEALGISERTLYRKIREYGIE